LFCPNPVAAAQHGNGGLKEISMRFSLAFLFAFAFLAFCREAPPQECVEPGSWDCNGNLIPDSYDISPAFAFPEPLVLRAAGGPLGVVVADLNGDGRKDLATADQAGSISIFFNQGNRAFEGAIPMPAGEHAVHLAASDIDRDGRIDLVVAGHDSGTVGWMRWFRNQGGGSFIESPIRSTLLDVPFGLIAEDLDGDSFPDLAVTRDFLMILWNRGDGTFEDPEELTTGLDPASLAAADFDGDGRPDLAVANRGSGDVSVLRNLGGRSFAPEARYPAGREASHLAAADLDGDGKVDLAVGSWSIPFISVLRNSGDGTFLAPERHPAWTEQGGILAADLDGDRRPDLVTLTTDEKCVLVLRNRSGGEFARAVPVICERPFGTTWPRGLASADLDDDGRSDLVVTAPLVSSNQSPDRVQVLFGVPPIPASIDCDSNCIPDECETDCNGNGRLDGCDIESGSSKDCNGNGIPDECEPDCDRDGVPDTCEEDCDRNGAPDDCDMLGGAADCNRNHRIDSCEIAEDPGMDCNGNGILDACELLPAPGFEAGEAFLFFGLSSSAAGDLDGDGDVDLAVSHAPWGHGHGTIGIILHGDGASFSTTSFALEGNREVGPLAIGDFDGDGRPDLAVTTWWEGQGGIAICLGREPGFAPGASLLLPGLPSSIASVDLDLDGDLDLCAGGNDAGGGAIWALSSRGNGAFEAPQPVAVAGIPDTIVPADLDGDGDPDLAVATRPGGDGTGRVTILWNGGSWTFESEVLLEESPVDAPLSLAAGDLDGDGDIDLAMGEPEARRIGIYENEGNRLFRRAADLVTKGMPAVISVADLDGDMDLDISAAEKGDLPAVRLYFNGGLWRFTESRSLPSGMDPRGLHPVDLDGDGDRDIAVAAADLGMVGIFRNGGAGRFPAPHEIALEVEADHMASADFDGDGRPDLAVGIPDPAGDRGSVKILWNGGAMKFGDPTEILLQGPASGLLPGDFDGDGLTDLAAIQPRGFTIAVHSAPRGFTALPAIPVVLAELKGYPAGAADLNGDRFFDLILVGDDIPWIFFNDQAGGFPMWEIGGYREPTSIAMGDLDGDGIADLAVAYMDADLLVYLSSANHFEGSKIGMSSSTALALGDFDGDRDLDLIAPEGLAVNLGGGSFLPVSASPVFGSPLLPADLDGDGDQDLIACIQECGAAVFVNAGHPSFRTELLFTGSPLVDLTAEDLNGDGTVDMAFLGHGESGSSIWIIPNRPAARSFDTDGDGILDECEGLPPPIRFIRGDANRDGQMDLSDAITALFHLFGGQAIDCRKATDADDSGSLDITDPIQILGCLFLGAGALPRPSGSCGIDPTPDALGCERFEPCP
jgi:hypothetical protein